MEKVTGSRQSLVERAEDHGEDNAERAVETGKRIGSEIGMLIECDGYPGMG
jgi:hypothetical protein